MFNWMDEHKAELEENWNRLQNGEEAVKMCYRIPVYVKQKGAVSIVLQHLAFS
jgi:hypothetical protein